MFDIGIGRDFAGCISVLMGITFFGVKKYTLMSFNYKSRVFVHLRNLNIFVPL